MTTDTSQLRVQYALAYGASLPRHESARQQPGQSDSDYADVWAALYAPELAKVVRIVQTALEEMDRGVTAELARVLIQSRLELDGGQQAVRLLLVSTPPLHNALLTDETDDASYRSTLEEIVAALS